MTNREVIVCPVCGGTNCEWDGEDDDGVITGASIATMGGAGRSRTVIRGNLGAEVDNLDN